MSADNFVVKDSGKRLEYATGARRDTDAGKPRYDLISAWALTRLAHHLRKGAEKYGDHNWEKGIPTRRLKASAMRHVYQYLMGDRTEDHLSAVLFNFMCIIHFEELGGNPADKETLLADSDVSLRPDDGLPGSQPPAVPQGDGAAAGVGSQGDLSGRAGRAGSGPIFLSDLVGLSPARHWARAAGELLRASARLAGLPWGSLGSRDPA